MKDALLHIPKERPLAWFGGRIASQVWVDERGAALERQRERRQVVPPAWLYRSPTVVASWFCMPATRDRLRGKEVTIGAYCGMPPGYRCERCGNGYQDQDPGDE